MTDDPLELVALILAETSKVSYEYAVENTQAKLYLRRLNRILCVDRLYANAEIYLTALKKELDAKKAPKI